MTFAGSSFDVALPPDAEQWECIILRAVAPWEGVGDPNLNRYDSLFETTHYPTEYLWGPGSVMQAADWYATNRPESDVAEYLDRTFLVNVVGDRIYQPRRPEQLAGLPDGDRSGTWFAIRADHPQDAYVHALGLAAKTTCSRKDECKNCHAATIWIGEYDQVVRAIPNYSISTEPGNIPDIRLPLSADRERPIGG